jgi:uncharacterized protein YcgL (UPF0745 family)
MDKMFSIDDIRNLVGNVKMVKFDQLVEYKTIEQLLPKQKDCVVIFYETESASVGHWTALCRLNQTYIFYDSYGNALQEDFSYIPKSLRNQLGIEKDYLKNLLKDKHVITNHIDFQKMKDNIMTCGRFVAIFLYVFKRGYSLSDFEKIMKKNLVRGGFKSYDELAVAFT